MKPFTRILIVCLAALALIFSLAGAASRAQPALAAGKVFTVYPTGVDDTDNIQQAFELAKAAGPGSTVLLAPGYFRVSFVEVWNFDGYFKGSGEDVTFVDTFPDQECQARWEAGGSLSMFSFRLGYARVSDLTIHVTPASPCQAFEGMPTFNALAFGTSSFNPDTDCAFQHIDPLSGSAERITIEGEGNIGYGVAFWGQATWSIPECKYNYKLAQGEFRISQAHISGVWTAVNAWGSINSRLTFGGSPSDGNTIENVFIGLWVNDQSASTSEISYNTIENAYLAYQTWQGGDWWYPHNMTASSYNIHHNNITIYGDGHAIDLLDSDNFNQSPSYPSPGQTIIANVHHNQITLTPDTTWGIVGAYTDGARIHQNTIRGTSDWAMVFIGPSRDVRVVNNDLRNYTTTNDPAYKIWLGEGAEDFLVRGKYQGLVLDEGTNNRIKGQRQAGTAAVQAFQSSDPSMRLLLSQKMERLMNLLPGPYRNRFEMLMHKQ